MADAATSALGLSIGATNLAAATAGHTLTRKPVLTLYRQRPPEVGVPSENPRLDEPGLVIADFVDRVGNPAGIVAADGSTHRSEALLADALRALAYSATGGRALPERTAVTYPACWGPAAVDALGAALSRVSEWSSKANRLTLLPDAAAALVAVRANPGIPAHGTVAVCDFGGSGSSITLVDAASDYQPVAPTVRYHDFSGDLIDQALLTYLMTDMPTTSPFGRSGSSAVGSLARLRAACRLAKEQLSSSTVTSLAGEVLWVRGDVRITRGELRDVIRYSLDNFLALVEKTCARNQNRHAGLAAVVAVGGGANIPAIPTMLSGRLGVPVVTSRRPQLTAAIGAALRAARGPSECDATAVTPESMPTANAGEPLDLAAGEADVDDEALIAESASALRPVLVWSEADDDFA